MHEPIRRRAEQVVEVSLVLFIVKLTTGLPKAVSFVVAFGLKDVAGFKQDFADVSVKGFEPVAEFLVISSVVIENANCIADDSCNMWNQTMFPSKEQ